MSVTDRPADAAATGPQAAGAETDGPGTKGSAEVDGGAGRGAVKAQDGGAGPDGAEIPQQRSTDDAAEHEAGEGAPT